ncbi:antibiotic biosynthesis monooxygenase [Streptomyces sp. NPDC087843]|uniref:antibiotic biosynthesis monooxygenase n=1 Tax=Streptomyces sp. NPDC087843 TaxID=3365804 RepID=UPI00382F1294
MFSVLFEVRPGSGRWDDYLGYAKMLKPELEGIDGFVDNIRYGSLTRDGWILSLSNWDNEKALVRWRTRARHHGVQEAGRAGVLSDYHLRVGQLTADSGLSPGQTLPEQRLDETETGQGTTVLMVSAELPSGEREDADPRGLAERLGLVRDAPGLLGWDVFDAVLTPGDVILVSTWRDHDAAEAYQQTAPIPDDARSRRVRVVRDYNMRDREEAPQYYPDVE